MVKGISRQVIVMHSPDPELFDQAIFILKDTAVNKGITEDKLMKEARKLVKSGSFEQNQSRRHRELLWACAGALLTGAVWLLTALI